MTLSRKFLVCVGLVVCAAPLLIARHTRQAANLTASPYKASRIYELGEKVGWTLSLPAESAAASSPYHYTVKKNNAETIASGDLDLSSGSGKIDVTVNEPAMIYVQITPPGGGKGQVLGAAVAPTKLQPAVERPADFDSFWDSKIKMLKAIPANPLLTPGESGRPDVEFSTIKMDHINGTHVYGQFAKPTKPGKYPALLILQWASPPYPLQKSWVLGHAADGFLTLNIEPHDVLPDQPASYYAALPAALKNYASIGQEDRDKSYFLQMYLADYRAVDYLASRPDWDGKTLVVMGTSMGGQQSLCVAGLNHKITNVIVEEPSGCDTNAPLHGRQQGYPFFPSNDPKIMKTALYFDSVNFASRIKAPTLVAMGFVDTIAPPAGIWTAFNQIKAPKQVAPMPDAPHNNTATAEQQQPFYTSSGEWLSALAKGEKVHPKPLP